MTEVTEWTRGRGWIRLRNGTRIPLRRRRGWNRFGYETEYKGRLWWARSKGALKRNIDRAQHHKGNTP